MWLAPKSTFGLRDKGYIRLSVAVKSRDNSLFPSVRTTSNRKPDKMRRIGTPKDHILIWFVASGVDRALVRHWMQTLQRLDQCSLCQSYSNRTNVLAIHPMWRYGTQNHQMGGGIPQTANRMKTLSHVYTIHTHSSRYLCVRWRPFFEIRG